jgi:hypothetical protein
MIIVVFHELGFGLALLILLDLLILLQYSVVVFRYNLLAHSLLPNILLPIT